MRLKCWIWRERWLSETKTLKDEDIKSIAEVVRALLCEELEASMQQVTNKLDAVQTEVASLTTRIISAEGELATLNRVLRFAADFSDYTAKHRRAFSREMAVAREKGTDAFLLYPNTLKIKTGHATHLFSLPADAEQFLDHRPSPSRPGDAKV